MARKLSAILLALCLVTHASAEGGEKKVTLKLATILSASHPIQEGYESIAKDVEKASGGNFKIEIYPNSQLGGEPELVSNCGLGLVDLVSIGPAELAKYVPDFLAFETPYMFENEAHFKKFYATDSPVGSDLYAQLEAELGVRPVMINYFGARHLTTRDFPVNTVADLAGKKIRCPNAQGSIDLVEQVFKAAATPMNLSEVYLALQNGTADGQENPIPNIFSNKFNEVQKYLNMTGHVQSAGILLMSSQTIEEIGDANYQILVKAIAANQEKLGKLLKDYEQFGLDSMTKTGMQVVRPTDMASFLANGAALCAKYENDGAWSKGLFERVQALK